MAVLDLDTFMPTRMGNMSAKQLKELEAEVCLADEIREAVSYNASKRHP